MSTDGRAFQAGAGGGPRVPLRALAVEGGDLAIELAQQVVHVADEAAGFGDGPVDGAAAGDSLDGVVPASLAQALLGLASIRDEFSEQLAGPRAHLHRFNETTLIAFSHFR